MISNRNKLIIINELKLEDIDDGSKKFIIDGNDIQTKTDYLEIMTEKFDFPQFNNRLCNLDGYLDWMTDLIWLDKNFGIPNAPLKADNFSLIITNYRKAFGGNFNDLNSYVIEFFIEDILPYWEEHETYARKFNVYLVENLIQ